MTALFSFGYEQSSPNRYVRMRDRAHMFEVFGAKWSMEYPDTPEIELRLQSKNVHPIELDEAIANHERHEANKAAEAKRRTRFCLKVEKLENKEQFFINHPFMDEDFYSCRLIVNDLHSGEFKLPKSHLLAFLSLHVAAPTIVSGRNYEWEHYAHA